MNAKRDCPGVPNRYSFSVWSIVTQPKSIAMVVVVLAEAGPGSSTPTDSMVISASVVSGEISEIAPTVVVLPTPNPPATMILTGIGGFLRGAGGRCAAAGGAPGACPGQRCSGTRTGCW